LETEDFDFAHQSLGIDLYSLNCQVTRTNMLMAWGL